MRELRPYQAEAIENIRATLRNGVRRMVVQGPCGFGKTLVAATIANGALAKNKRMAFVCPAISLIDQTVTAFYEEGCRDVGVMQASHSMSDRSKPIQVCSIQTIASRGEFPQADIVIFDEIHSFFDTHKKWLTDPAWAHVPFIGMTATPWTKGLGKYFDTLLVAATTSELINQGHLSKFRVFATGKPDLSGVKIVAGDYHESQLSEAMQKGSLTADIVRTWKEKWGKDKTFVFAVDCAHAQTLQERFIEAGVKCAYQDARTSSLERAAIKRGFHDGTYQVICNVGTLTVGVDYDVRCLVLARPTRSEMLFTQIIGRALRTAEGKDAAIILDHSETTARLGLVTDITHEHLDEGKPKNKAMTPEKKTRLPKECQQCTALVPRGIKICPNCGHEMKIVSGILEDDGELVEVTAGERQKKKGPRVYTMIEKAHWFAGFKYITAERGYKAGYAAAKYKDKFGVWPRGLDHVKPMAPSTEIIMWMKSRDIAWAKRVKSQCHTSEKFAESIPYPRQTAATTSDRVPEFSTDGRNIDTI